MGEAKDNEVYEEDLVDYEEEVENVIDGAPTNGSSDVVKKGYVGIHSSGFRDFLLKPELLRAIQDCGFEHPSEGTNSSDIFCWRRIWYSFPLMGQER